MRGSVKEENICLRPQNLFFLNHLGYAIETVFSNNQTINRESNLFIFIRSVYFHLFFKIDLRIASYFLILKCMTIHLKEYETDFFVNLFYREHLKLVV